MIRFPCSCSYVFTLEDDMAGSLIQCPRCRRLTDIPHLNELPTFEADGTLKLDEVPRPPEDPAQRLEDLDRSFSRLRAEQEDIDLRSTVEPIQRTAQPAAPQRSAPRYDPITGELIRPLELRPLAPPATVIPFAKPAVGYSAEGLSRTLSAGGIFVELFRPINFVVLCVILALWLLGQVIYLILNGALSMAGLSAWGAYLPFIALVLAHYGNVIDETGRESRDELPRPLRDLGWGEDLWGPFSSLFLGLLLCFWPLLALLPLARHSPIPAAAGAILLIVGTLFLPAVWLTLLSSGAWANLRPDRLFRTMTSCGLPYFGTVLVLLTALAAHAIYLRRMLWHHAFPASWLTTHPWLKLFDSFPVALSFLFLGTYLMHFACWHLGAMYNRHHEHFDWIFQRHIPDPNRGPRPQPHQAPSHPPATPPPLPPVS